MMTFWKRLLGQEEKATPESSFERKESQTGPVIYMNSMGRPIWTPREYAKLAEEAYIKNAIANRCVRMIAEGAAAIPWLVYVGEDEAYEHPLLDLLKRPNPLEGGIELMERFYSFIQLSGNVYLEAVRSPRQQEIAELWVLRPDRVRVKLDRRGYPAEYVYKVGQNEVSFRVEIGRLAQQTILHFKTFHPTDDVYGLGAVEPGAFSIDVHNQTGAYNQALLQNLARPSGALVYSPKDGSSTLRDDQFQRLKEELEQSFQGAKNAGRPMVLEGGLDWRPMSTSPKDMEMVEGKRDVAREIALSFGVPPMLLGIPGDNTYSNYQEANRAFYRQTVLPLVGKVCRSFTNFFSPTYGDDFQLWYDVEEVHALAVEREAVWDKVQSADWLTVNEKREATGYDPYDEIGEGEERSPADQIYMSSSLMAIEDAGMTLGGAPDEGDDDNADEQAPGDEDAEQDANSERTDPEE